MNIVDLCIIIFILFGALLGFKRGFLRETVEAVGLFAVIVLAYLFKNPLSVILYEKLPFIKIGILKNVEILNILLYEIIAFLICLILFYIVFKVIAKVSSIIERILTATIILAIPSKIAGAVIGIISHFIFAFVILYILTLTCFNIKVIEESNLRLKIINNTPILSLVVDKSITVIEQFNELRLKANDKSISEMEFHYQAMELFLKYNIITPDNAIKLIDSGKISSFDNYIDLINKYKEGYNGNN